MTDLERIVEALLFLSPQAVTTAELAEACDASEAEIDRALDALEGDLAEGARGVVLRQVAGGHTLAADPIAEDAARRLLSRPRTPPLTQLQAETLAERGLIEESGRSRFGAIVYRTTPLFEKLFGLSGLDQLPDPSRFDPTPEDERELRERLLKAGEQRAS